MDLPWVEKYRPINLSDIVDNNSNVRTLQNMVNNGTLLNLLLYGPPGTGKTSTALALARQIYGSNYRRYILELNASDERGIDTVRNKIPEFAKVSCGGTLRMIILDEADAMTSEAQNALRRVIEQYANKCRFCLICNDISAIIPGLQSRCVKLRFCNLDSQQLRAKLQAICQQENISLSEDSLDYLVNLKTDFRVILNTLQCLNAIQEPITPQMINQYLGIIPEQTLQQIIQYITQHSVSEACRYVVEKFQQDQWTVESFIDSLLNYVMHNLTEPDKQSNMLSFLATIESQFHTTNNQTIQLYALVARLKLLLSSEKKVPKIKVRPKIIQ